MDAKRASEISEMLRNFAAYAQNNTIYMYVCVEKHDFYVDLGAFGEQSMSVEVEEESYEVEPDSLLSDHFPMSSYDFDRLADEMEALARSLKDEGAPQQTEAEEEVVVRMAEAPVTTIPFDR